jgi:N-acetylneuraminic acid mutarotase
MPSVNRKHLCLVSAVLIAGGAGVAAHAGPGPSWTELSPVPHVDFLPPGVEGMSVAQIDGHIFAAFGLERNNGDTARMRVYDIAGDSWSFAADGPGPSSEGAGIAHGGLFYSVGGRLAAARNDIWSYNPDTDTWDATLMPMSQGRAGLALAAVGDSIYAIGGRLGTGGPCSGAPLASVERYDVATDTWTAVAPLPSARSDLAAAAVGGKVYVFGGCNASGFLDTVNVYDPRTDTWSEPLAAMPTARAGLYSVATKGNTVYVIGGWNGVGPGLTTNEAYNVAKDAWTADLPAMPTPRGEAGAVGHGGRIYVIGGSQPAFGNAVAANEVFKP